MSRRRAVLYIITAIAVLVLGIGSITLRNRLRKPDLSVLERDIDLIAEIADTIIPATETVGAKAVHAERFIIAVIRDCTGNREQQTFIRGLSKVDELAYHKFRQPFTRCTGEQRVQILQTLEEGMYRFGHLYAKLMGYIFGRSFISLIKELTVSAFCTSQKGATDVLLYDYIPGAYTEIIDPDPARRGWAVY